MVHEAPVTICFMIKKFSERVHTVEFLDVFSNFTLLVEFDTNKHSVTLIYLFRIVFL
jgi:hypothetical protein